ncbi:MAG TPA: hypothetical protein VK148_29265 [Xanthobacteraceae bacterium]|nr:hypothetical protein [Xanthobacteraceae bacterium]
MTLAGHCQEAAHDSGRRRLATPVKTASRHVAVDFLHYLISYSDWIALTTPRNINDSRGNSLTQVPRFTVNIEMFANFIDCLC